MASLNPPSPLPPQWKRTKRETKYSKQVSLIALHQGQQTDNSSAPFHPDVRHRFGRQTMAQRCAFRPWRWNSFFFCCCCNFKKVTEKENNIFFFWCNYLRFMKLFKKIFPSFPADVMAAVLGSRARLESNGGRFRSPHWPFITTCTGPHCAQTLTHPDWAGELNLIISREKDHKSALNL